MREHYKNYYILLFACIIIIGLFLGPILTKKKKTSSEIAIQEVDTTAYLESILNKLVLVEAGEFMMGSETIHEDNRPVHKLYVDTFFLSKYPVTVDEFRTFVQSTGYKTSADITGGAFVLDYDDEFKYQTGVNWECDERGNKRMSNDRNYPVLYISWMDAQNYCMWLSNISHKTFRLPTEAEWEFACRGGKYGKGYMYSGGDSLDEVAWYALNSELNVQAVGQKKQNELGLYDMTGLAWEWCSDWYSEDYYQYSPEKNPQGPPSGVEKVCRGSCYLSGFDDETLLQCQIAYRGKDQIGMAANAASFRIVMDPNP